MSETSLRHILETAAADLRTLRQPNVGEAGRRLDAILGAAGLRIVGGDRITRICIDPRDVAVEIEYGVRGCIDGDTLEFPATILDAPDPVAAATLWGLERRRAEALREIERARRSLAEWEATLAEVEGRLAAA